MGKQKQLLKQIIEKLRTDSGSSDRLVELTKHRSNRIRIGRDTQARKDNTPYLGVMIFQSIPINNSTTFMQFSRLYFCAYSRDELTAISIADRIETLLDNESGTTRSYYDFSGSSAGEVRTRSTRFKGRLEPEFEDKTEVWTIKVEADVIWDTSPCT